MPVADVKMMHAGPWGPRGSLVSVNIEHDDRKSDVKRRVSHATGIPVDELKLCCASPTQLAAASKKCPGLSFGNCGVVERLGLTVVQAESGEKSFVPRLSPNRIDNLGALDRSEVIARRRVERHDGTLKTSMNML
ncbi:hypothetical protein BE221DRAFT_148084 [Ostreococcus tauri]|uniref:Uncharacterized protein n=1 Tax=Ostreococcus tauri TaxID=70448 RepID=A0A1Y5IFC1_OSTTA|nr:hypothetical protein BE221DRAFT_148084 [Ostreococcus tauri]